MDDPSRRKRAQRESSAEARAAQRRLQSALRKELQRRQAQCRYNAQCPVALAGNCPGIC